MRDGGGVVVVNAGHVSGTCGSGIVSNAADVLGICGVPMMRGVGGVCEMCMCLCLSQGSVGEEEVSE